MKRQDGVSLTFCCSRHGFVAPESKALSRRTAARRDNTRSSQRNVSRAPGVKNMHKYFKLRDMNWMDVEEYLESDKRVVIPLGSTEEHGYLSVLTDTLITEHITTKACEKLGILLYPVLPFGCSYFAINYPGTIALRTTTYCHIIEDIVNSLYRQGMRRVVFVSGHGGNIVISGLIEELHLDRKGLSIYYYNPWDSMAELIRMFEKKYNLGKSDHASWIECYEFTKVSDIPKKQKESISNVDFPYFPINSRTAKNYLKDGVFSGTYEIDNDEISEQILQSGITGLVSFLQSLPKKETDL